MAESKTKATTETKKKAGRPRKKPAETQPDEIITKEPKMTGEQLESASDKTGVFIVSTVNPNNPLNVRAGAGKGYKVVRQIPNETPVTVYEIVDGWGRIGPNEWVMMNLLK